LRVNQRARQSAIAVQNGSMHGANCSHGDNECVKAAGAWKYAADPHTEVICCAYAVDDGQVTPWTPGNPQEDAEAMDFAKGPARGWLYIRTNKLGMMTQCG
jgi:hypothetical protein